MTYSNTMALGRQHIGTQRNQNSVSFARVDKRLGPVSTTIVLIVLACLLGLLYLKQVTKTNTYGYSINKLEVERTSLKSQHDNLSAASARLQLLERVQSSDDAKALVATAPSGTVH